MSNSSRGASTGGIAWNDLSWVPRTRPPPLSTPRPSTSTQSTPTSVPRATPENGRTTVERDAIFGLSRVASPPVPAQKVSVGEPAGKTIKPSALASADSVANVNIVASFRRAVAGYLNDDRFSDFTVLCEGKEFKVHRCFICVHSKWFERCCSGMFQEGSQRRVELKEDLLETVELMIRFFYTFDYDDSISVEPDLSPEDPKPVTPLQMNAHMFAIAEKYEIPTLKALAAEKFKKAAASLHQHADMVSDLQRATYTVFKHIMLPDSEDTLKSTIISIWVVGGWQLWNKMPSTSLRNLFHELPDLGYKMTSHLMLGHRAELSQSCENCDRQQLCDRGTIATKDFKCFVCGGNKAKEEVVDNSTIAINKYW